MEGIKSGREKEKVSCRREGAVERGWELLIGSREFSRVGFVIYALKQIFILEVFFFFVCD